MVILNISAFLLMNFSAHTKVPDRYERWWVTRVTPCPPMRQTFITKFIHTFLSVQICSFFPFGRLFVFASTPVINC